MLRAALLALALLLAFPASAAGASIGDKCKALNAELNERRDPDVRLSYTLCTIAHNRAKQLANGAVGHNISYVIRKLNESGVCWRNVGEAIGWTTATDAIADRMLTLWRDSSTHWSMLSSSIYDRTGGSWRVGIVNPSRTYAVLLVADFC